MGEDVLFDFLLVNISKPKIIKIFYVKIQNGGFIYNYLLQNITLRHQLLVVIVDKQKHRYLRL